MRSIYFGLKLVSTFFLGFCVFAGVARSQTPTPVTKDPQAISVLTQSLNAVGGLSAIAAIQDYTGTGNITYNWTDQPVQAPAIVQGMGTGNYRLDASLSNGTQTWACNNATSGVLITSDGISNSAPFYNLTTEGSRTLPAVRVAAEFTDNSTTITYVGLVSLGQQQAYQIHFAQTPVVPVPTSFSLPGLGGFDLYFDPTSFLIIELTETVRSDSNFNTTYSHEVDFSNYQSAGNILAPFAISEKINGQQVSTVTLSSITFNSGLTSATFNPQPNSGV